uniref:Uncharacterized protein n=1 Tax=Caenorhabditis japonica TaxID=281687 RepID=A0A8R1E8U9_CAEJA
LAARAGKRLAQREKKLAETEDEIAKLQEEADDIVDSLRAVAANEVLTTPSSTGSGQQDPKVVAEKVRQLKDALKPVGEKMDSFNSDCKLMIKTAGPEADTKELD